MRTEHTGNITLIITLWFILDIKVSSLGICGTLFQHLVFHGFDIINHCKQHYVKGCQLCKADVRNCSNNIRGILGITKGFSFIINFALPRASAKISTHSYNCEMFTNIIYPQFTNMISLIYSKSHKQVLQVSGLCGAPFLSYLLKRFTQLYGALVCRHHTLMYQYSTPIWQLEIKTSKTHFKGKSTFPSLVRLHTCA